MTVREFMLKKFPTDKYIDCPVPKHHWKTIQEYGEKMWNEAIELAAKEAETEYYKKYSLPVKRVQESILKLKK